MKPLLLIIGFTLLLSCTSVSEEKLDLLNGYWEIERVEFPNGGEKEYKMSIDVDFIQLEGLKGFRKKMKPRFDGNFETSDDAEPFQIKVNEGLYSLVYKNNLSEWQESITALSTDNFSIQNEDGILYHNKRFEPISITP